MAGFGLPGTLVDTSFTSSRIVLPHIGQSFSGMLFVTLASRRCLDNHRLRSYRYGSSFGEDGSSVRPDHFGHQPLPAVWNAARPARRPHECFADETAIDFPSIHELLERMREDFLGENNATSLQVTDVSLSRRDACVGAVLPLDVPIHGTCRECGGRGETWTGPCDGCDGSGNSLSHCRVHLRIPAGISSGSCFRFRVGSAYGQQVRVEVRIAVTPEL